VSSRRQLLVFPLCGERYGLPLELVERVVRAVMLTPLPGAPAAIRGVFSLHGAIVPVGDLRRRLGLPERDIALEDQIVVARRARRLLGVLAEGDSEVLDCPQEDIVDAAEIVRSSGTVSGVARLKSGLILIQDLARLLSLEEERALEEALHARQA